MYTTPRFTQTTLLVNQSTEGEMLETKLERMLTNKEKITGGAPKIFTERKKGVIASTNIRSDRFEIALEASEKIEKSYKARREEAVKPPKIGETESTQGKGETPTTATK